MNEFKTDQSESKSDVFGRNESNPRHEAKLGGDILQSLIEYCETDATFQSAFGNCTILLLKLTQ